MGLAPPDLWCEGSHVTQRPPAVLSGTLKGSSGHMARASVPVQAKQVAAASPHALPRAEGQAVQSRLWQAETGPPGAVAWAPGLLRSWAVGISGNNFAEEWWAGRQPAPAPARSSCLGGSGHFSRSSGRPWWWRIQAGNLNFLENRGSAGRSGGGQGQRCSPPAGPAPCTGSLKCLLDRQAPGSVLVYLSEV